MHFFREPPGFLFSWGGALVGTSRIQGITVEIGGDTTKLTAALKGVNGEIRTTQSQQRKCLKASLVMRHRPDLLGELDGLGAARR